MRVFDKGVRFGMASVAVIGKKRKKKNQHLLTVCIGGGGGIGVV